MKNPAEANISCERGNVNEEKNVLFNPEDYGKHEEFSGY